MRKMERLKGKSPAIILYSNDQMTDLKKIVENSENLRVGIDRTLNLGSFFVTSINYKSNRVIRKESGDSLKFLGPVFLHKEANFEATLSDTFEKVDLILPPGVEIGSDDEKAITKAIDSIFPQVIALISLVKVVKGP